jgi:hypothetical protein
MWKPYLFIIAALTLSAGPARAQCLIACGGGTIPVEDVGTIVDGDNNAYTAIATTDMDTNLLPAILLIEQQNVLQGMAGGFDASQTLSGDLEQQVDSTGGMPLIIENLQQYPVYWPGYSQVNYVQNPKPGSPEADMNTILGTLWGALNARADQQASQEVEAERMTELEAENAGAEGNLQALEVANEIALFNGQEEIKSRNALNGQLNALLLAQSHVRNKEAMSELEGLAIGTELTQFDATNNPPGPDPQIPYQGTE